MPEVRARLLGHMNEQRITGEGREALIRTVTVAGGAKRKHLPDLHARVGQPANEAERLGAHIPDATGRRERGGMQQDAGGAGEQHG